MKYIVSKLKGNKGVIYDLAIRKAIENGHDEVAKWIACEPDLMPPKQYQDALWTAAEKQNYELLVFFSQNVPKIEKCNPKFFIASQALEVSQGQGQSIVC